MTRLEKAADYLEKLAAEQANEATPEEMAEVQVIIKKLRNHERKNLEKAVWASVFYCLKIKNAGHIVLLLEYEEGKSF